MGGLRFGDQVLQINGNNVAGFGEGKVCHVLQFCFSPSLDGSSPEFFLSSGIKRICLNLHFVTQVHDIFKKADVNNIVLAVRDRPFERTVTLHKDSTGHLGFQYREVAAFKD